MSRKYHEEAKMYRPENRTVKRTITLEEHFMSPTLSNMAGGGDPGRLAELTKQLLDLGEDRIAAMDAAGIDVQVLSLSSPGVEQLDTAESMKQARESNECLVEALQAYPERFAGFASLPTSAPDAAADELELSVSQYGFKGALINGHTRGRYLDDPFFRPILERAVALSVPLYLHPTPPPQPVVETYYAGFAPEVTARLATSAWGWHIETATHVLRMILGGVFDRYPELHIVIGHLGEGLPFMLSRLNSTLPMELTKLERPIASYLRENLYYTIAGFNWTPTFLDLLLEVGVDRIMFSTDYPYGSMKAAQDFLEHLPVSPVDREKIAHGNAEQLLHL